MPEYANITMIIEVPSAAHDGNAVNDTSDQSTKNVPIAASTTSGVSLIVASTTIARAPSFTPNAFIATRIPYSTTKKSARGRPVPSAGRTCATCWFNAFATPGPETTLPIHISAPVTNPQKLPYAAAA